MLGRIYGGLLDACGDNRLDHVSNEQPRGDANRSGGRGTERATATPRAVLEPYRNVL